MPTIHNMMEQLIYDYPQAKMIRINPDSAISSKKYMDGERYVDVNLSALEGIQKIKEAL